MQVKDFQPIAKFAGGATGEAQGKMWATVMKMVINSIHPSLVKVLKMVEAARANTEVTGAKAEQILVDDELEEEHRTGGEVIAAVRDHLPADG